MRKLLFLFFIGCIAVVAAQGQTSAEGKILTADDFKADRRPGAAVFWLQIHPHLAPVQVQLAVAQGNGRVVITPEKASTPQSLTLKTALDAESFTRLFTVMDVNFDGYLDLAAVAEAGAKWGRLNFWLYEPKTGRFVTNALTRELAHLTHNGIEPNAATKELVVAQFPQATPHAGTLGATYRIAKGHLLLIKLESIMEGSEGLKVVKMERVRQGTKSILKVVSVENLP